MSNCNGQGNCTGKETFFFWFFFLIKKFIFLKIGPNTCTCNTGYKGAYCNQFDCANVGNCNSNGVCSGNLFFFFLNKKCFSNQNYKKKVQIIAPAVQDTKEQTAHYSTALWWVIAMGKETVQVKLKK